MYTYKLYNVKQLKLLCDHMGQLRFQIKLLDRAIGTGTCANYNYLLQPIY